MTSRPVTIATSETTPLLDAVLSSSAPSSLASSPPAYRQLPEDTGKSTFSGPDTTGLFYGSAASAGAGSDWLAGQRVKHGRTVSFNPNPVSRTIESEPNRALPRPRHMSTQAGLSGLMTSGLPGTGLNGPPMLSALNTKLRRRHSQSAVTPTSPTTASASGALIAGAAAALSSALPKAGPQRSSKTAQKLKLLPNPEVGDEGPDEESGRDVYSQYTRIKDPTARRDAAMLGKADRNRLPRVTAYCTANKYDMDGLMRFLKGRGKAKAANPKLIDECIYTPYTYSLPSAKRRLREDKYYHSTVPDVHASSWSRAQEALDPQWEQLDRSMDQAQEPLAGDGPASFEDNRAEGFNSHKDSGYGQQFSRESMALSPHELYGDALRGGSVGGTDTATKGRELDVGSGMSDDREPPRQLASEFDTQVHTSEVFLFDYGVVVIWGMSSAHEQRFLKEIAGFETEKLAEDVVETELFNFYYTQEYQARIYNDFITLRDKSNYMIKLAISHALAQSVKTSLFEQLIASSIETCKDIPYQIALTGKIALSRSQIYMQIGELFILRINIHLSGSVLDTPELFWAEPQLQPVYKAVRSYLEMDQRVGLMTSRLEVIADLLAVLKDQLSHGHGEKLEWIVIILIAAEILVAAVNILVDLYATD